MQLANKRVEKKGGSLFCEDEAGDDPKVNCQGIGRTRLTGGVGSDSAGNGRIDDLAHSKKTGNNDVGIAACLDDMAAWASPAGAAPPCFSISSATTFRHRPLVVGSFCRVNRYNQGVDSPATRLGSFFLPLDRERGFLSSFFPSIIFSSSEEGAALEPLSFSSDQRPMAQAIQRSGILVPPDRPRPAETERHRESSGGKGDRNGKECGSNMNWSGRDGDANN